MPQHPAAPMPHELPKIQAKNAVKIQGLAFPRLHFPALTTTSDQIFEIIATRDPKITPQLWDGTLGAAPTQRYSHWKSIPGAQPSDPSWKTAQPEQNHNWQAEKPAKAAGNIHPTCWKHRAGTPDGGGNHPARDWHRNPAGSKFIVHQIPFSCLNQPAKVQALLTTHPPPPPPTHSQILLLLKANSPGTGFFQQFSVPSAHS